MSGGEREGERRREGGRGEVDGGKESREKICD